MNHGRGTTGDPRRAARPRVLVTDAVPVNGGDEALLVGLLRALGKRRPDADITVLCHRPEDSRRLLPSVRIEAAIGSDLGTRHAERFYRDADIVVSTPGGFLHDHYDMSPALRGFELATSLGRPLVLFAQSIGPFARQAGREAVGRALSGATLVAVREHRSVRHLADCGVTGDRVVFVPDAAFLWRDLARGLYAVKPGPPRRVGLCFRQWPRKDQDACRATISKARRLVEHLAARGIAEFLFVSTCQGVPDYVDDSELAVRIVAGLEPSLRDRCVVDRTRHHTEALIGLLSTCDVFAGMRLHGCLLALLGGTPAMGLAYEQKTPEIFGQLGLGKYQVPFTSYQTRWCTCASGLLDDLDEVRAALPATLDAMAEQVWRGLERLDGMF